MSTVEYTRCDGKGCGRVTPEEGGIPTEPGWARVNVWEYEDYDLCPECALKAFLAVGIEVGK